MVKDVWFILVMLFAFVVQAQKEYEFDYLVIEDVFIGDGSEQNETVFGKQYYFINSEKAHYYALIGLSKNGKFYIKLVDRRKGVYAWGYLEKSDFSIKDNIRIPNIDRVTFVDYEYRTSRMEAKKEALSPASYSLNYSYKKTNRRYNSIFNVLIDKEVFKELKGKGFQRFRSAFNGRKKYDGWITEFIETNISDEVLNHRKLDTVVKVKRRILIGG